MKFQRGKSMLNGENAVIIKNSSQSKFKILSHFITPIYHWVFIPYAVIFLADKSISFFWPNFNFSELIRKKIKEYIHSHSLEDTLLYIIEFFEANYIAITIIVFLFLAYKLFKWLYRKLKRFQYALNILLSIERDYQNFVHVVANKLPNPGQPIQDSDRFEIIDSAATFVRNGIDRLSQLLLFYTGYPTHVSFKSFAPDEGLVKTHHRLIGSGRSIIDDEIPSFSYKDNTAFQKIIENEECSHFVSNNLRRLEKRGLYKNLNSEWKNHYNATIVVPSTNKKSSSRISLKSVNGFVCADNKKGNFDEGACVNIINSFACQCYNVLQVLGYLEEPKDEDTENERTH